jgi:hypothetical protein
MGQIKCVPSSSNAPIGMPIQHEVGLVMATPTQPFFARPRHYATPNWEFNQAEAIFQSAAWQNNSNQSHLGCLPTGDGHTAVVPVAKTPPVVLPFDVTLFGVFCVGCQCPVGASRSNLARHIGVHHKDLTGFCVNS